MAYINIIPTRAIPDIGCLNHEREEYWSIDEPIPTAIFATRNKHYCIVIEMPYVMKTYLPYLQPGVWPIPSAHCQDIQLLLIPNFLQWIQHTLDDATPTTYSDQVHCL